MIDEILGGILGEIASRRVGHSKRAQLIARLFFGLLGGVLAAFGFYKFAVDPSVAMGGPLRLAMAAVFFFLGAFCLLNVAFARTWRWPGKLFLGSLVALFATRILLGP